MRLRLAAIGALLLSACAPFDPNKGPDVLNALIAQAELIPYAAVEAPLAENIRILTNEGARCLEFRLIPLQPILNQGIRSEVSVDLPWSPGARLRYEWQFLMPADFKSDAPRNRWWVFADWHVQPDTNLGQTWDNFTAGSSPVQFSYGETDGGDQLAFAAGTNTDFVGLIPFRRETWHTVRMEILWSQSNDGRVEVYFDGAAALSTNGPNMKNAFRHYMKIGQYRNRDILTDNRLLVRRLTIDRL